MRALSEAELKVDRFVVRLWSRLMVVETAETWLVFPEATVSPLAGADRCG